MKLNSALLERTLSQFQAQVVPDSHPAIPQLTQAFGDHTFFLNDSGLCVVEPAPTDGVEPAGKIVNLASWSDETLTSLVPHPPEVTGIEVALGADHQNR
jgi:hypothetical protein